MAAFGRFAEMLDEMHCGSHQRVTALPWAGVFVVFAIAERRLNVMVETLTGFVALFLSSQLVAYVSAWWRCGGGPGTRLRQLECDGVGKKRRNV